MGTIMVPENGDLIYAAARDMGLKMTQLSEKLGMRDRDYVSHSARKGKMSLEVAKKLEGILHITVISDVPVINKKSIRRRLTPEERQRIVECLLTNKTAKEAAQEVNTTLETARNIYDRENLADFLVREAYRELRRKKESDMVRTSSAIMYRGRKKL